MSKEPFRFTICAMCGKQFIKSNNSIYHVTFAGHMNQCCSYRCYNKALEIKNQFSNKQYLDYYKEARLNEILYNPNRI